MTTNCPMCKQGELLRSTYDEKLPINECDFCGGAWLRAHEYAVWLRTQTPGTFDFDILETQINNQVIEASKKASICPDCGHLLRSYKIGSNVDFNLDRCNTCHGVWFDKNEWGILKAADLHDEINKVFTRPWQNQIGEDEMTKKFEKIYLERFGLEDYDKIREIRAWLAENPNRNTLLAYLIDEGPYKA